MKKYKYIAGANPTDKIACYKFFGKNTLECTGQKLLGLWYQKI